MYVELNKFVHDVHFGLPSIGDYVTKSHYSISCAILHCHNIMQQRQLGNIRETSFTFTNISHKQLLQLRRRGRRRKGKTAPHSRTRYDSMTGMDVEIDEKNKLTNQMFLSESRVKSEESFIKIKGHSGERNGCRQNPIPKSHHPKGEN